MTDTNDSTTAQTHPFVLDLLGGWAHQVGDERYSAAYHQIAWDLYQKAGAETVSWGDDEPPLKDMTAREQFAWLLEQLPGVIERLEQLEGAVYTPPPVEDQDDDTPFPDGPQDCEVILTDKVIHSALVFVTATSRKDAAEKARDQAEADAVEWTNTYESEGYVNVAGVKVGEERGR